MKDKKDKKALLKELIQTYRTSGFNDLTAEANIRAVLIDPLFAILDWDVTSVHEYDREAFVRGAGFADVKLSVDNNPVAFLEAKRIGAIPGSAERQAKKVELLPEERQAIRYARSKEVPWAILTNFERLIVFDADDQRPVLVFDSPEEYEQRFDQLLWLSKAKIQTSLSWWKGKQKLEPVDLGLLNSLEEWRLALARDIFDKNRNNPVFLDSESRFSFETLLKGVQRILNRLIIIQFADDKEVLEGHDILKGVLDDYQASHRPYRKPIRLLTRLRESFELFDRYHNTTIFGHTPYCDEIEISDEVLQTIIEEIIHKNFRGFKSDILGNTYESYLGHKLVFNEAKGDFEQIESRDKRRGGGIYYTPYFIVKYIVDHTLGAYLEGKSVEDIQELRVLDPACGSGSFLIYAFDVLADFYEKENQRREELLAQAMKEFFAEHGATPSLEARMRNVPPRINNYPKLILEKHLYGVDADPEAAEIATVNLVMKAFERHRNKKMPLILNQNIKVGNSLVSGVQDKTQFEAFHSKLVELIDLRNKLTTVEEDSEKTGLLEKIDRESRPLNDQLNKGLPRFFTEVAKQKPFNWEVEFPEVFDPRKKEAEKGFTIVIGNPPYVRIQRLADESLKSFFKERYNTAYKNYDLYVLFAHQGINLLQNKGHFGYILPNKFFQVEYGEKLREMIAEGKYLKQVVNFADNQVFKAQTTYTCLLFLEKSVRENFEYCEILPLKKAEKELPAILENLTTSVDVKREVFPMGVLSGEPWGFGYKIELGILEKARNNSLPLKDLAKHIIVGIQTSADEVYILRKRYTITPRLVRAYSVATKKEYELETELLKPLLSGEDVQRYGTADSNKLLLFPYYLENEKASLIPAADLQKNYPQCWAYLKENEGLLRNRENGKMNHEEWYAYIYPKNLDKQECSKLAVPRLVDRLSILYDHEGRFYLDNVDVNGIILDTDSEEDWLYTLALLNSKLLDFIFKKGSVRFRGRYYSANKQFIENLPVRRIDFSNYEQKRQYEQLVQYARIMLDGTDKRIKATHIFAQVLQNRSYEMVSFGEGFYYQLDFALLIGKEALPLCHSQEPVTEIFLEEKGDELHFLVTFENGTRERVLKLAIETEHLRLFLFYAIRIFLEEHQRRKKWTTKIHPQVLDVILNQLEVPIFRDPVTGTQKFEFNMKMIELLMEEFKKKTPVWHLSEIESRLSQTDLSINQLVYELYGLTEEERRIIERPNEL